MCQVPKSYTGNGPFVFVSYSHKDKNFVYEDIFRLQDAGINVWFDEKLTPGIEWFKSVERQIVRPSFFGVLFYVSENFLNSDSIWREVNILFRHKKVNYFPIFLKTINIDKVEKVDATIRLLYANRAFTVEGLTEKEILDSLEFYFEKVKTFADAEDSERITNIEESIRDWGYFTQREEFPLGNVLHNGHIEYLPSLLEATPFNFTYVTISNKLTDIAESLNSLTDAKRKWEPYSLDDFLSKKTLMGNSIIVSLNSQDINRIPEILSDRRQYTPQSALLINICVNNIEQEGPTLSDNVQKLIDHWDQNFGTSSRFRSQGRNDYCLLQTDKKILQLKPVDDVLTLRMPLERWRYLLTDKVYYTWVVSEYSESPVNRKGASWLLHQKPLGGDNCFDRERGELESDRMLIETWDWEAFCRNQCEWEK